MVRTLLFLILASSAWAQTVPLCGQGTNFACKANLTINIKDYVTSAMCAGTADPDSAITSALTAAAGKTLFIPSGCKLRLKNTGATSATNITIPTNTTIKCEDATAGFGVVRQRCTDGTYVGAACTSSAECLGGTTCAYDYGSARYASTAGQTYTMFQDAANGNSQDIVIENCGFWTDQADPYQRCAGTGGNVGKPCRQECSDATVAFDGMRCEADGDCPGGGAGSCLNRSDCTGSGGTNSCGAAPGNPSTTSTAKINVLDLSRTSNVRLVNVSIYDHFQGDFAIKTGANATFRDVNTARELTDGTTPFAVGTGGAGQTPPASLCLGTNAPLCYYGAYNGATSNVQPTTSVTNGVVVGIDSQLIRVTGRGTTTSITAGLRSRLDECTVYPYAASGPGTAAAGFSVGQYGQVAKSQALWLASGATGIALTGSDATAIENKLAFATSNSNSIGIDLQAANQHATGNNISGIGGSSGKGIQVGAIYADVKTNFVSMSNGAGVYVNADDATVTGNQLISNPVESMLYGIQCNSCNNMVAEGNQIERVLTASFKLTAGFFAKIIGNTSNLVRRTGTVPVINSTVKPIHILDDGSNSNQKAVTANTFSGGWRGYDVGTRVGGLLNISFGNNRFQELAGAAVVAGGGAGVNISGGNYFNSTGQFPNGPATVCNATCSNRGSICVKDADCTSCAASTMACTPEPIVWLSSPNSNAAGAGAAHPTISGNLIFNGWGTGTTFPMVRQCVSPTTNNVGQICETSTSSGAGCTGGSGCTLVSSGANTGMYLCSGGTDDGKRCCSGGTPTCSVRAPYSLIRYADTNSANAYVDMAEISGNLIFSANSDNEVGIDLCEGNNCAIGSTGVTFTDVMIGGNQFKSYGAGSNNFGVRFPTSYSSIVRNSITGNNFTNMSGGPVKNWASGFGIALANGGLPAVVHAMTWFFPGLPTAGVQTPIGIVRAGLTNCSISGAQIAIGTVAANNSVWNIQRCTANCDGSSAATFTDIWSSDDTINNDKYNVKSSGTLTTTIASGDLFKVDLSTVGAGTADYSVTMTYLCDQ